MPINVRVLKALHGDCLILKYGLEQDKYILIDGGIGKESYRNLKIFVESLEQNNAMLSLVVLTHIDSDHIDGILKLFSEENFNFSKIDKMWFNYGDFLDKELNVIRDREENDILLMDETNKISWKQGNSLEKILKQAGFQYEKVIKVYDEFDIDDAHFTILSPSLEVLKKFNEHWLIEKEHETQISTVSDYEVSIEELNSLEFHENISLANKSSLAFIFEYQQRKVLLLGDASATEIEAALSGLGYSETNPLSVDICKISHHASKHNTSDKLIKMLQCKNYIISTNITASGRPSKECLSRIICNSKHPVNFYCNYEIDINRIFTKEESEKYGFKMITIDENGIGLEDLNR